MNKLTDYSNRCGSCKNFAFLVKKNEVQFWGFCSLKNRANYHQASQKACKLYVNENPEK